MIYTTNLEALILKRHMTNESDHILILGGWLGLGSVVIRIAEETVKSDIIYGCYSNAAINQHTHNSFVSLTQSSSNNATVYYKNSYNHSKIYCWLKNKKVVEIIAGSANFSTNGFKNGSHEILFDVHPNDYSATHKYLEDALLDSQRCDLASKIKSIKLPTSETSFLSSTISSSALTPVNRVDFIRSINPPSARIYLGGAKGVVEKLSGPNVSQNNNTPQDDWEIGIRAALINNLPSLFPNNGINPNIGLGHGAQGKKKVPNAEFLWDDGEVMEMSFEGGSRIYKQLRSFPSNRTLGSYLRKRMNIPSGSVITDQTFQDYGRNHIDITLSNSGYYHANFSPKNID